MTTVIALDLDETFLHSKDAMAAIMAEETGVLVAPYEWNSYDLAKVWMDSGLIGDRYISNKEVMGWFVKHNLFAHCKLAPGSAELYDYCRKRSIKIEFVTARGFDPDARSRTMNMLRNAGIHGGYDLTIVDHMESKHPHMKCARPLLFVDDNAQQVLHLMPYAAVSCIMAQPHNEAFRKERDRNGHPLRTVNSMWDVLDVLMYLNAQQCLTGEANPTLRAL